MKGFRTAKPTRRAVVAGATAALFAGCSAGSEEPQKAAKAPARQSVAKGHPLWPVSGPPVLRGAVIAQRRRHESIDGPLGSGFAGGEAALPSYKAREFEALAAAGANLVVMSYPEFWTAAPPYRRDQALMDQLGRQMDLAKAAGLYVVVALRSGPGRSDFIFHRDSAGDWFPKDFIIDIIWRDAEAQAAWGDMCADVAKLIAARPETAGLTLMVEPDANFTGIDRGGKQLDVWQPSDYARRVSDASDWRRIAGDCAMKVRAVSADLPILISPPAFARPDFLPVMGEPPVEGCIWCVHDYEPRDYTHQGEHTRGVIVFDQKRDAFDARLKACQAQGAPVFLGEFGVARWAENTPAYYKARAAACEARGVNWAAFRWPTQDAAYEDGDAMFNVTWGAKKADPAGAALPALREAWARNTKRP